MTTGIIYGKKGCNPEFYFVRSNPEGKNTVTVGLKLKEYNNFGAKKIIKLFKSYYLHDITLITNNASLFPEYSLEPDSILYFVYIPNPTVK